MQPPLIHCAGRAPGPELLGDALGWSHTPRVGRRPSVCPARAGGQPHAGLVLALVRFVSHPRQDAIALNAPIGADCLRRAIVR